MRSTRQRNEIAARLFALTNEGVRVRNNWRSYAGALVWLTLTGFTILLSIFGVKELLHIAVIAGMAVFKYGPILAVAYALAKKNAARYLDDIYELNDENTAAQFIEEVAFGYGREEITIKDGKISEEDELSPLILIGGPGLINVHLGSVALLEKVDGTPEVISPRKEPWNLDRFERIREIGKHDEPGKREYAFINLRDQFVGDLSIRSRTKDGIPIEAHDIKAIFSIDRPKPNPEEELPTPELFTFEPRAVEAIVYKQTIITPEPTKKSNIPYPWDITAIPLITSELENLITSRTLSEILATIGQKEMDQTFDNDKTIAQMRIDVTGQLVNDLTTNQSVRPPNFESRSKITSQFYDKPFTDRASSMGIKLHWIDIGTWKVPSAVIQEKHKEAGEMLRNNANQRNAINKKKEKFIQKEFSKLFKSVVLNNFERTGGSRKSNRELESFLEQNPAMRSFMKGSGKVNKDAASVALDILKAFRKELIAGKDLIEKDTKNLEANREALADIDKALHNINNLTSHWV
jgi:hypothetical protein